ncbi:AAA family ATPase [Guyparkeria halophila]|uniref:AAA family ATPase n=1 Tax=Guyparkeria halophila TaxID=47960 RepID=A0A6I6D0G7_9GAMM|nr:AAA family ATPase [Guyparkeria halophila]QGT77517.1 AAA family ATPase [Guyparkeria halophila]
MASTKPRLLKPNIEAIPQELQDRPQWVVWKADEITKGDGTEKITKVPHNPKNGRKASIKKPDHWGTFDQAADAYLMGGYTGLGFVFTADDPFVGIDLDNCFDETGELREDARQAVDTVKSFTERSPSGNGLHIICKADIPAGRCENSTGREMYRKDRFFTITADVVGGHSEVIDATEPVRKLYRDWFGEQSESETATPASLEWDETAEIVPLAEMPVSDHCKRLVSGGDGMERYTDEADSPDRSAALLAVCTEMVMSGINKESILTALTDPDHYLAGAALERRGGVASAMDWLWKYTLSKAFQVYQERLDEFEDCSLEPEPEPKKKKRRRKRLTFTSAAELIKEIPPTDWLIGSYLQADTMNVLFGAPKVGKSFLALDMACCIATGRDWHGHPVKQGSVFYIAGEGHGGIRKRLKAWAIKHGVTPDKVLVSNMATNLTDEEVTENVLDQFDDLADIHGTPALIVVDTLARNFGGKDEDNNQDMGLFVHNIDTFKLEFGAATLIVHHTKKNNKEEYRGASALEGAADATHLVKKKGDGLVLEGKLMKDAAPPSPKAFHLQSVHLEEIDEESAVPVPSGEETPSPVHGMSPQQRQIWEQLESLAMFDDDGAVTQKELTTVCGLARGAVSTAVKRFETLGLVTTEKNGRENLIRLTEK